MALVKINNRWVPGLLALLRIVIGWHFLYEGLIKLFNPDWTARSFLEGSRWILGDMFRWMASGDTVMQIVDFANSWGLTLAGLALILGLFTRLASWAGITMLAMYYLAYPPFGVYGYGALSEGNYLLVNKNLIELVCLMVLAFTRSGEFFGLDLLIRKKKLTDKSVSEDEGVSYPASVNKRRELLKGMAGLPFLAAFSGIFIRNITLPGTDARSEERRVG